MKKQRKKALATAAAVPRPFPWIWIACLAAITVAFVIYGPSLNGAFVYDDLSLPFLDPAYRAATFYHWIIGVRPVLMATYWLNHQASGLDTGSYHAVNVLLHACNAILVGLIVRRIANPGWIALFCGAVFLAHPLNTEAVSYVASRSENLTVFLYFSAFALFLYGKPGLATHAAVLLLFGAACLSKEYAVTLPILLFLTDLYFHPEGPKANAKLYAAIAVVGVAGVSFVWTILQQADTAGFALKDLSPLDYFMTQCRALLVYLREFFLPVGLNIDHDFPISRGWTDPAALASLTLLLAISLAAFYCRKTYPFASYGWFVFLLLIAPTSSFVPIRDVLVERRMYLPSLGVLFIVTEFLKRLSIPRWVYAVPVLVLAAMTFQRNQLWNDSLALWRDAAEKSPNKWRVRFQVADALYRRGDCAAAAAAFERTSVLGPPDYRLAINWAHALDCAGQPDAAMRRAQEALGMEKTAQAYSLIGTLHAKANRTAEAMQALDEAIRIGPTFDPAYFYRGNVHLMMGDTAKAAEDYRRALALNPANEAAARGLARANRR